MLTQSLRTHLAALAPFVPAKATLPILQGVHLFRDANALLTMTGTDLETHVTLTDFDFESRQPYDLVIERAVLAKVINRMGPHLKLEGSPTQLLLSDGNAEVQLPLLERNEFPLALPEKTHEKVLVTTAGVWRTVTKALAPIITKDLASRPSLMCLAVSRTPSAGTTDGLEFAATDGYRLGVAQKSALWNQMTEPLLLPMRVLTGATRLWQKAESLTVYRLDRLTYQFVTEHGTSLTTQMYDGRFPDYHGIMKGTPWEGRITVEREALERIVMLAAQVTEPLDFTRDGQCIRVDSAWHGQHFKSQVPITKGATPLLTRINVGYLAQVCTAMPGDRIHLNCTSRSDRPVSFEQGELSILVMPMNPNAVAPVQKTAKKTNYRQAVAPAVVVEKEEEEEEKVVVEEEDIEA